MNAERPVKGVKSRIFGVVMMILGGLDGMLAWRGGFEPSPLFLALFAAGALLFAVGVIRGGERDRRDTEVPR